MKKQHRKGKVGETVVVAVESRHYSTVNFTVPGTVDAFFENLEATLRRYPVLYRVLGCVLLLLLYCTVHGDSPDLMHVVCTCPNTCTALNTCVPGSCMYYLYTYLRMVCSTYECSTQYLYRYRYTVQVPYSGAGCWQTSVFCQTKLLKTWNRNSVSTSPFTLCPTSCSSTIPLFS